MHGKISNGFSIDLGRQELLRAYTLMQTIRLFEERLHDEAANGKIPGFLHLYAGQEASAVGVMMHLHDDDKVASTHRGHGHCIAKGLNLETLAAEIFGKATGLGRGKGGTMHIADFDRGFLGTNGVVGAGAPLICGAALAAKMKGNKAIGVAFFGDGASNQGTFLESLNLAATWNLPVLFVIENNGYAESTSRDYAVAVDSYIDRAAGFGLPGVSVDGTDFFAVYEAAGTMIERAREGGGASLMECSVERLFGHFEGDTQAYRPQGEVEAIRQSRDCIKLFLESAQQLGRWSRGEVDRIDAEIAKRVDAAVSFADQSPYATAAELTRDVYSTT